MPERNILFHEHPDAMWVCSADALEFLDVNDAALSEYGYSREEFLGQSITALWPPEDAADVLKGLKRSGPGYSPHRTFRLRRKSGEILHVELKTRLVDWGGRSAQLVVAHNVTDRVQLEIEREALLRREESLRQSAEQLASQLSEQEASHRAAQRLIGIGAWRFETWSNRLTWSPEIFRIYGLDESTVPSFETFCKLVHPDDRDRVVSNYRNFTASEQVEFDFIHRVIRSDGTLLHIRNMGETAQSPDGKILVGIIQDLTQEVEQRNRLNLLDLSVSRLNDAIVIFEARTGADVALGPVVYANGGVTRVTGLSGVEIIGRPILSLVEEVLHGVAFEELLEALQAGTTRREEIRLFARDGRILPAEIDLVPVRNEVDSITHWVAVVRDMSEGQAARALARLNEERYQMVSRSTNDVVWDLDVRTGLLNWNENFRRLTGSPDVPLTDRLESWSSRLHPDDCDRVVDGFVSALDGIGESWTDEYRFLRDDGEVRFIFDRGFISRDETGAATRIVGSMVDVTRQKIAEARLAQAEKLDALGQLTGGVAHDFNNLLTVIIGNTETLLDREDVPRDRRLLELISMAADRGRDLTGRLLAFARKIPLKPVVLDLNDQVERSAELMRRTFRSNVSIVIDSRAPGTCVEADPGQLDLVILNLALNARTAMPDGGRLTMETDVVASGEPVPGFPDAPASDADRAILSVSDTGSGMDAETLRRCLEPFFTTKPVGKGVGLGLSMAHSFMEQSGGQLLVRSVPHVGTTVALLLPVSRIPASGAEASAPHESMQGGHEHILLVEDDAAVRDNAAAVLSRLGYRITACGNADEAIAYLQDGGNADLLLTDIMMPGARGVRALVAEAQNLLPEIQVLYISGYPRELINDDGRLSPDIDFLSKPYRRAELADKVRLLLDRAYAAPAANR